MHAYWRVLRYMYTGRYLNDAADVLGLADDEELIKDVRVYALADLFLMDDLKKQATRRLASRLEDARGDETLVHCIKEVYNFTSDDDSHEELRDLVSEKAYSAVRHLWKLDEFRELVRDGGDFVVDFVAQKAERR
ncbi:hypothetical protein N3K66_000009 [Trichothecium roseum]|uniref:Uncharacterized protein n=1 Tax=Trichothecium roseum TaxID=47278 RepID=A0ACC0VCB5_9HYPO|nr:hypothetical protein N3K66_000009 [Trichothecium roseum]